MALYRINGLHFRAWAGLGDVPSGEGGCEAQGRGAPVGDVPSGEGECDAQERGAPVGNVPSGEGECETHG